MPMTALQIVQRMCARQGLPQPASVASSQNNDVIRMLALLNEGGEDLRTRHDWKRLMVTRTWPTVANANQGTLQTVLGADFDKLIYETFWDGTRRLPLVGPLSPQEYRSMVNMIAAGIFYQFTIQGGNVISQPAPPAGLSWNVVYYSLNWVQENTPVVVAKDYCTKDDDTFLVPDNLLLADLRWRYRKEIGLPYAEEQRMFEEQLDSAISNDGGRRQVDVTECNPGLKPGIFVPEGNWPV